MGNTTKGILAMFGVIISALIITMLTVILLDAPAEKINAPGVMLLMVGSVLFLGGVACVGIHAIFQRED